MDVIFRDQDLYTIIEQSPPYEGYDNDDGYGFYYELDYLRYDDEIIYDIENDNASRREIKYNKKAIDELIRNEGINKDIKRFDKKYAIIVDYCMFGLVVFSCSMIIFQSL